MSLEPRPLSASRIRHFKTREPVEATPAAGPATPLSPGGSARASARLRSALAAVDWTLHPVQGTPPSPAVAGPVLEITPTRRAQRPGDAVLDGAAPPATDYAAAAPVHSPGLLGKALRRGPSASTLVAAGRAPSTATSPSTAAASTRGAWGPQTLGSPSAVPQPFSPCGAAAAAVAEDHTPAQHFHWSPSHARAHGHSRTGGPGSPARPASASSTATVRLHFAAHQHKSPLAVPAAVLASHAAVGQGFEGREGAPRPSSASATRALPSATPARLESGDFRDGTDTNLSGTAGSATSPSKRTLARPASSPGQRTARGVGPVSQHQPVHSEASGPLIPPPDTTAIPAHSPDRSYMRDQQRSVKGSATSPSGVHEGKEGDSIPPTRIPERFHVVERRTTPPEADPELWTQLADATWVRTVFPSFMPTGRQQAMLLGDALAAMLSDIDRGSDSLSERDVVLQARSVYSACFFEVLRQVSVQCIERGTLLKKIWGTYEALFTRIISSSERELSALRAQHEDAQHLWRMEQGLANSKLATAHATIQGLEKKVEEQQDIVDALRAQLERYLEASEDKTRLLDEIAALHTLVKAKMGDIQAMRVAHGKAMSDMEAKLAEEAAARKAADKQLQDMRERYDADMGNLRDRLVQANQMAEMLRNRLEVLDSVRRVDADCQTDEIVIASPAPVTPVAKRKIRAAQKAVFIVTAMKKGPMSLRSVIRIVLHIYRDKIRADAVDDSLQNRRQNMQEYVADWFLNRHGMPRLAQDMADKLKTALRSHRKKDLRCDTFGRLWGAFGQKETWPESTLDIYLALFGNILASPAAVDCTLKISRQEGVPDLIVTTFAQSLVDEFFEGRLDASELSALKAAIHTAAVAQTEFEGRLVDEEQFLRLCVEHWHMHEDATKKMLESLFKATDTNGNGLVDLSEFLAMLGHLSVGVSVEKATLLFGNVQVGGEINKDIFVQLMLKMNEFTVKKSLGIAELASAALSPEEMMQSLRDTWQADEDTINACLHQIKDADVLDTVTGHIESLKKLIAEEGGEPQAAWLAYRMLVSELSPYLPASALDMSVSPPSSSNNTPAMRSRRLGGAGAPSSALTSLEASEESSSSGDEEGEA